MSPFSLSLLFEMCPFFSLSFSKCVPFLSPSRNVSLFFLLFEMCPFFISLLFLLFLFSLLTLYLCLISFKNLSPSFFPLISSSLSSPTPFTPKFSLSLPTDLFQLIYPSLSPPTPFPPNFSLLFPTI